MERHTEQPAAPPATLLIVDDDRATREGLARLLADDGFRVLTADSFERAVAVLKAKSPDLLLLDVRLGEFNGLQLLVTGPRTIPAIVMTGYADAVLERDARQLGAEFLVKPITHDALLSMIERQLPSPPPASRERRWRRKRLPMALPTRVNRLRGQLLDVSYGGVRFEVDDVPDDLPPMVAIALPGSDQYVHAEVVWSVRQHDRAWECGAAVIEADDLAAQEWRELVDSV
jgi:two-component system, OmpR family, response regulator